MGNKLRFLHKLCAKTLRLLHTLRRNLKFRAHQLVRPSTSVHILKSTDRPLAHLYFIATPLVY